MKHSPRLPPEAFQLDGLSIVFAMVIAVALLVIYGYTAESVAPLSTAYPPDPHDHPMALILAIVGIVKVFALDVPFTE